MRSQVGALLRAEEGDWFDMASQSDLAEVVRAELNRGTASGKPDWAATSKAQLPQSQGNTNRLDAITSTLDDVAAAVGARSAGLLASPAVLAVLLFVALLVGLAIGVGIDAE
jgi:aryl-alcohol dehydrogenase-like predicted oxidoreductase